jgi:hypothetical protein
MKSDHPVVNLIERGVGTIILIAAGIILASLAALGLVVWIAWHFISKFW